ncbi:MAG: helix-turn-helix transcriptional regulator [Halobacteriovoraceae bacterium]|nr:helix-turn-helix transcriptional regulator [Halobacteriovoraceae bacterium]
MIEFNKDAIDWFIGIVRKYMHIRGDLSQKDLAEAINVGISTLSRFLNQKTKDIDEQLVAKIVAYLDIPLHEIIDFIEEESDAKFKKLVAFYKDETMITQVLPREESGDPQSEAKQSFSIGFGKNKRKLSFGGGTRSGEIKKGDQNFPDAGESDQKDLSLTDKINSLSPRQMAYVYDFLDLDVEGKDLLVDIGNQLLRYFKQKRLQTR